MSSRFSRVSRVSRFAGGFIVVGVVGALSALTGCSSSEAASKENVDSYESELRLASPKYLGQIANGETKSTYYNDPPRYRAYGFSAKGGDEITVDVKSVYGDAMGWITTSAFDVVAANDDASSATLDSKVVYKVPAGTASRAYRAVFRDYDLLDATFTVKLTIKSQAAVTCSYDGDTYSPGASFPSTDGCNTCSCGTTGSVACTKKACLACDPDNEWWRNYIGTPTTCQTIRYVCASNQRSFQNTCGCGCEALSH
ncbi:MAG: hypothetical protein JWP87_5237 [Labilithrix sp.]|nr:hypothetical protein [Labilithrix sp.]